MEIYKRTVGYEQFGRTDNLVITASTLYFPVFLKQNFEDIGIYTDTENPVYEIVDLSGVWNLSNDGLAQKPCLVINNCTVTFSTTPITYFGANNGSLSATVTGCPSPQTLEWTGPNGFTSTNLNAGYNNLASGNYTLKVSDANCDITYKSIFLQQPQGLSFNLASDNSQTNATSPGGCNGDANVVVQGGLPPYSYLWYSGTTSNSYGTTSGITSLCAGVYTVQITDSNGSIVSSMFTITEPTPISGSVTSIINVDCSGSNTGVISANVYGGIPTPDGYKFILTGPTPITITGSTGSATFNNLLPCPISTTPCYTLQILDSVGNTTTLSPITVSSSTPVTYSYPYTNVTCYDSSNGSITVNPAGGTPPYNSQLYLGSSLISPTQNGAGPFTWSDLDVGTYTIKIKDSKLCNGPTQNVVIKQKPKLNLTNSSISSLNGFNIPCYGNTTGVTFTSTYTSDPTTYSIATPTIKYYLDGVLKLPTPPPGFVTTKLITMSAGTHTITVIDSPDVYGVSCSATTVITLTQPPMKLSFVGNYVITSGPGAPYTTSIDTVGAGSVCAPLCVLPGTCVQGIINVNGGVAPYTVTWNILPTSMSTTGPAWGVGITSNPLCSNNTNYGIKVTVVDANGCTITSVLKFPRVLP